MFQTEKKNTRVIFVVEQRKKTSVLFEMESEMLKKRIQQKMNFKMKCR